MTNKKLFTLIVSILMVLAVPFIIYGFNFNSVAFDEDYYKKEFSKYNVYGNLENYDIEKINSDVLNYLKNEKNNELIKNEFFNEREKIHLLDVKNLIQTIFTIFNISIILFLSLFILLVLLLSRELKIPRTPKIFDFCANFNFKKITKKLLIILVIGSLLTLLDAVIFFILSNFNFNFIFDLFHKTFFSFGTYTFNPDYEIIVVLYPQNLFFDFLVKIIFNTILSSIIILFFSIISFFIFFKLIFSKSFRKILTTTTKNRKL
ncbi:MAG: DUF1461 domain-containing protein [Candidatus Woesearchaeota archaeon]|jgi:uncharacterized membrane protein|nr:hypothetical protein [Candidatus Woesearchaeota archaeon]MDP6600557.1 DUF1461 domain-containing protein [Candidatus Woesearchaeota archaeon]|tara:strand:+ start:8401 stop:9186 length:786 start_codon:yes stop_codon:yes gene_type:complete